MINIAKIAKLANLPLVDNSDLESKLEETIKYVDVLKKLDTSKISPTSQVGKSINKWREDIIEKDRIIPEKVYRSKVIWT